MTKTKIAFWVSTTAIFLFEGVLAALTVNSEAAIQGFSGLGYPPYFLPMLTVFKVLGALALIIPAVPPRVKEWAYAGFTFDFIAAFISIWAVGGLSVGTFFPIIVLAVLAVSYLSYHKING